MKVKEFQSFVFEQSKNKGLEEFELYYSKNTSIEMKSYKEEIDSFSSSESFGISFRCIVNGKMGYSYTEKVNEEEAIQLVSRGIESAKCVENDDVVLIYGAQDSYHKLNDNSDRLRDISVDDKMKLLTELDGLTKSIEERVSHVEECVYFEAEEEYGISNSKGLDLVHQREYFGVLVSPVVKQEQRAVNGYHFYLGKSIEEIEIEKFARDAVSNVLSRLGAKTIKSGNYKVLLENKPMALLLQANASIFSSDQTQKGLSLLKDKEGEKIASSNITIIDNPHLCTGLNTATFDNEGVATYSKEVVSNGVLSTLLYNLKTAEKAGKKSTGNGFKSNYRSPVSVSPSNFYIQKGESSIEELLQLVGNGVLITDLSGIHAGANAMTGDFSLAAKGFLIENGKKSLPIEQITVSGNFFELLKQIDAVGTDLSFTYPFDGYFGSPSVVINELSIAGE